MKAILGIKKGMTRVFKDDKVVPVTVIDASDCILSYIEAKGFELGLGEEKSPIKSMKGKYGVAKKVPEKRAYFKGELEGEFKICPFNFSYLFLYFCFTFSLCHFIL